MKTILPVLLSAVLVSVPMVRAGADSGDRLFPTPVSLPKAGEWDARMLAPDLVQIRIVGTTGKMGDPLKHLESFFGTDGAVKIPETTEFEVTATGAPVQVAATGYLQLLDFAAFQTFDVRVIGSLFLKLSRPLAVGESVGIRSKGAGFWPGNGEIKATWTGTDFSPVIHVNQIGYVPALPKIARAGLFLGSLGEMEIPATGFSLVTPGGEKVWSGQLVPAVEEGWGDEPYQKVLLADFSEFKTPGEYRIEIPGLGRSAPFRIHDDAMAYAARAYALGSYHQLCGGSNDLPFTRFTHPPCHTAPAQIPTMDPEFKEVNNHIRGMSEGKMENVDASLFPFVRKGTVDVSGGYHDAGDYSKYMNSVCVYINHLAFATDCLPGEKPDNLGIPQSGDGIPDALQLAKWQSDFVLKMQDDDGGFFFLVYPKDRKYEDNVLPENGDPQVVFPKNMISTAEAVGALAEMGSSPAFKKFYPQDADSYMAAAKKGYDFLRKAVAEHGFEGSHQPVSHYGALFDHRDEMAYAAAAMFAATGDKSYEEDLKTWWPDPTSPESRRWGWWHLIESYGNAARVYALAQLAGRPGGGKEDPDYLQKMRQAVIDAGNAQIGRAEVCAYGIPIPVESKRFRAMGWFWGMDAAFDVIPAALLDESLRKQAIQTLSDASGYEFGTNPSNRPFVTGTGNRWMREIVHQYAMNDDRVLPPTGIPYGNVFGGPHNMHRYKQADGRNGLNSFFYPDLGSNFPFYDRSGTDAYNVTAEFTIDKLGRHLAGYIYLMGQAGTPLKPWKSSPGKITGAPEKICSGEKFTATLEAPGMPPVEEAQVVWEASGSEPSFGPQFEGAPGDAHPGYLEVEAVWPDGRRVFARHDMQVSQANAAMPSATDGNTLALVPFDELPEGRLPVGPSAQIPAMTVNGSVDSTSGNVAWNRLLTGRGVRFNDLESSIEVNVGKVDTSEGITLSFWLFGGKFSYGVDTYEIATILEGGERVVTFRTGKWPNPRGPEVADAKGQVLIGSGQLQDALTPLRWHFYQLCLGADGTFLLREDGRLLGRAAVSVPEGENLSVRLGGFIGYVDDLLIQKGVPPAPESSTKITGAPGQIRAGEKFAASLEAPGMPPVGEAKVVWKASGSEPFTGPRFEGTLGDVQPGFLEVDAVWPDGRRAYARHEMKVAQSNSVVPSVASAKTVALVSFDELPEGRLPEGVSEKIPTLTVTGPVHGASGNVAWNRGLTGRALRFNSFESSVELSLGTPDMSDGLTVSFWLYGEKFSYGVDQFKIATILDAGEQVVTFRTGKWPNPRAPDVGDAKGHMIINNEQLKDALSPQRWHFYQLGLGVDGSFQIREDGRLLGTAMLPPLQTGELSLRLGGFMGYLDDLHVQKGLPTE